MAHGENSSTRGLQQFKMEISTFDFLLIHDVPDGVCNPVRNVLHIHESKY